MSHVLHLDSYRIFDFHCHRWYTLTQSVLPGTTCEIFEQYSKKVANFPVIPNTIRDETAKLFFT
jgi:hypothetical protein